ncbi:AAA family ATPase [Streptomyces sp. 1222.5]|uniref:AAA family ATPase n=1 Tax=Streptomyces sp. 1222.5 TaxID=1881026 RepID=UPI003D763CD1
MRVKHVAQRAVVVVSGAPASGKTTLAFPLARALGWPILSKDLIKECLHDALGGPSDDREYSRRLSGAVMQVIWATAAHCPQLVIESDFYLLRFPDTRERLRVLDARVVEVYCDCPPEESARRYAARGLDRHPCHYRSEIPLKRFASFQPLAIGPVIRVDTTNEVHIHELVQRIRAEFATLMPSAD